MNPELYEVLRKKTKAKKSSRKKVLTVKNKSSEEFKCNEKATIKVITSKKPPLFKKQSLPLGKTFGSSPKGLSNISNKRILIQENHNSAFYSDAEKSNKKIENNRAKSNLENSLKNKLELSQKLINAKKNYSPNRVEKIIKDSLKKAKNLKTNKERELRQKHLLEEIKKIEHEHQNNLIRQLNLKKLNKKKKSKQSTSAPKSKRINFLKVICLNKSKNRSSSTKHPRQDKSNTIKCIRSSSVGKEYFSSDCKPSEYDPLHNYRLKQDYLTSRKFETLREVPKALNQSSSESSKEATPKPSKTGKVKVTRNISLIDTNELNTYIDDTEPEVVIDKKNKFSKYDFEPKQSTQELKECPRDQSKSNNQYVSVEAQHKKIEKFREENSAKKIQRAYRKYIEAVSDKERDRITLREIVKDQIGWREAQMLSIEYLREKELEDMRSLTEVFGHHSQVEEIIVKTISQRYEQFTKIFQENLNNIESEIIDRMDTSEIVDFSNKIQKKRDTISKLIEDTNLNNSLSRQELEHIFKETQQSEIVSIDTSKSKQGLAKEKKVKSHNIKRHFPQDHLEIEFQSSICFEKPPSPRAVQESIPQSFPQSIKDPIASHLAIPIQLLKEHQETYSSSSNSSKNCTPVNKEIHSHNPLILTKEIHSNPLNLKTTNEVSNLITKDLPAITKGTSSSTAKDSQTNPPNSPKDLSPATPIEIHGDNPLSTGKDTIRATKDIHFSNPLNPSKNHAPAAKSSLIILQDPEPAEMLIASKDPRSKTISVHDMKHIEATMLSPIFPEAITFPDLNSPIFVEGARYPSENQSVSPLPARPSAPLMFLDMDDCNISLESLLNSNTPNRKNFPGLPLLNLGSIPASVAPPLTSDPRIETTANFVGRFTREVFQALNHKQIALSLSEGIRREPLELLKYMHESDLGSVRERGTYPSILNIQHLVDNLLDECLSNDLETTQRFINKADRIHKIMILTVADELLQRYRPYGIRGVPMDWSSENRIMYTGIENIGEILREVGEDVEEIARFEIGKIATEEMILSNGSLDEELLQDIRDETLCNAVSKEIVENEWIWIDYEFEETQTKLDLADMVLTELIGEFFKLDL